MTNELHDHVSSLLINSEEFEKWLELWDENAIVGESGNCNDCPISNFVLSHLATEDDDIAVIVGSEILNIVDDQYETIVMYDLPKWTTNFINSIDELEGVVTVNDCLNVLEGIQ
jgi:hypothetical protein